MVRIRASNKDRHCYLDKSFIFSVHHNCQEKLQATKGPFLSSLDDKFHFFHKTHIINAGKTSLYLTPLVFLQVFQFPLWGKTD